MSRVSLRWYEVTVIAVTVILAVHAGIGTHPEVIPRIVFFAAFVLTASFLRVRYPSGWIGFEAAVAFPAIILFHEARWILLTLLAGSVSHALWIGFRNGRLALRVLYESCRTSLTYYFAALLFVALTPHDAALMTKASAYLILVVGALFAHLSFAVMEGELSRGDSRMRATEMLLFQTRSLLLLSPMVVVAVLIHRHYGMAGFAVAFLPVLLVSYVMTSESILARKNVSLSERNRELALLGESSRTLLSAESDRETFDRLIQVLTSLLPLKAATIIRWGSGPEILPTIYRYGECQIGDRDILEFIESTGFAESVPRGACVLKPEDRAIPLCAGRASQLIIGLITPEVIYGALIFETDAEHLRDSNRRKLIQLLVNQTAVALQDQLLRRESRQSAEELERKAETLSTILEVSNDLIGSHDVDLLLTRIAAAVQKTLGFQTVLFALHDAGEEHFIRRAHAGLDDVWESLQERKVPVEEVTTFFRSEFAVSRSYFVSHRAVRQTEHGLVIVSPGTRVVVEGPWNPLDMLMVPLMNDEKIIGYLSVREPRHGRVPSLEEIHTLEIFANQAVTALKSARQFEEIKKLTFVDGLTRAYNHRFFRETLEKEIHRHFRTKRSFTLVMLDVDDFKKVNDTWGHPVGDEVLKGLVEELISSLRDIDVVSRYGGEEFAVLFPDTTGDRGREVANRMRQLVSSREFPVPGLKRRPLRITISLGLAVYPSDGSTSEDLIAKADAALYHAKAAGKNQVAMASSHSEPVGRPRVSDQ